MSGRRWTAAEVETLERMIDRHTVAQIARRLRRSETAVNIKLSRLGLMGFHESTDLLTVHQICLMFGIEHRTIKNKWQKKGLQIKRIGGYIVVKQNDLIKYLMEHPEDWNATKVTDNTLIMQYQWYKDKRRQDKKERYFWTQEEYATLKCLRHQGYSLPEIARKMGRSESSIKYKLYRKKER